MLNAHSIAMFGRLAVVSAVCVLTLAGAAPSFASAAGTPHPRATAPGQRVSVYAGTSSATYRPILAPGKAAVRSNSISAGVVQTSTIQVTYHGFGQDSAAKAAFQAAINVWQSILVSDQVIHVDASWTNLGASSGLLGQAGANHIYLEGDGYWYPSALEESRCHCNAETAAEISADFNSAFPAWYKGTDGNVPSSKWDLETVVLHELGHGMGFFSSFDVSSTKGYWGFNAHPLRFDSNEWDAASGGKKMTSYANGSTALKTQLTDGSVYIGGANVEAVLGGRAKLYAPSSWQPGSSNSHLDESKYAPGTVNGLMTPVLNNGEAIHDPGAATVAILEDIGWTTAGSATAPGAPRNVTATAGDGSANVSWSPPASDGGSSVTGYTVKSSPGSKTCSTAGATSCTVGNLTNGVQYTFAATATNGVGGGPASAPSNSVVPHSVSGDTAAPVVGTPRVNIVASQVMGKTDLVDVAWPDAADDSGIASYELQRRQGSGQWVSVSLGSATSTSARVSISRGANYVFRVRATDGANNTGDWTQTANSSMSTFQETSGIVYSGAWTRSALSGTAGRYVEQSASTDATATFTFSGTSVALVTTAAARRGIAEITLDGTDVTLVDLYSASKKTKVVAWSPPTPLAPGSHTVVVRVTGTRDSHSSGNRIDIDAFLVWK